MSRIIKRYNSSQSSSLLPVIKTTSTVNSTSIAPTTLEERQKQFQHQHQHQHQYEHQQPSENINDNDSGSGNRNKHSRQEQFQQQNTVPTLKSDDANNNQSHSSNAIHIQDVKSNMNSKYNVNTSMGTNSNFVSFALRQFKQQHHHYQQHQHQNQHHIQHQRRRGRKGTSASNTSTNNGTWTVQLPKRMILYMGTFFLAVPVTVLMWKENSILRWYTTTRSQNNYNDDNHNTFNSNRRRRRRPGSHLRGQDNAQFYLPGWVDAEAEHVHEQEHEHEREQQSINTDTDTDTDTITVPQQITLPQIPNLLPPVTTTTSIDTHASLITISTATDTATDTDTDETTSIHPNIDRHTDGELDADERETNTHNDIDTGRQIATDNEINVGSEIDTHTEIDTERKINTDNTINAESEFDTHTEIDTESEIFTDTDTDTDTDTALTSDKMTTTNLTITKSRSTDEISSLSSPSIMLYNNDGIINENSSLMKNSVHSSHSDIIMQNTLGLTQQQFRQTNNDFNVNDDHTEMKILNTHQNGLDNTNANVSNKNTGTDVTSTVIHDDDDQSK